MFQLDRRILELLRKQGMMKQSQICLAVGCQTEPERLKAMRAMCRLVDRNFARRVPDLIDTRHYRLVHIPQNRKVAKHVPIRKTDDPRIHFWMLGIAYNRQGKQVETSRLGNE